ncbi:uncharacterized protein LOC123875852 [Maniola jurtina]|uniref:uncharacterized protein LOC123875852 n=1 Tax=Maniola jurtina TaxID=191418 RepID=UPI001E68C6EE|nr:uncharacterized protein LOC123875852 [Maniola jurtina]
MSSPNETSGPKGDRTPADPSDTKSQSQTAVSLCSLNTSIPMRTTVLLATACVRVLDSRGTENTLKCLIDNASQHNYITNDCVKRLNLHIENLTHPASVNGFGGTSSKIKGISRITIFSRFNNKSYSLTPLIVDKITDHLPTSPVERSLLNYLESVPLADNTYHLPSKVDMILGAQMFTQILLSGRVAAPPGMPHALQTTLGYILMGTAPLTQSVSPSQTQTLCAITNERLDNSLRNFFELEDVPSPKSNFLSMEEQECEDIYKNTTERDSHGRYIVALPFKSDPSVLGNASLNAEKRFNYLERKLEKSPSLRDAYNNIIDEYLEKDYLSPVTQTRSDVQYVIPHHGVQRDDKVSTKVRIVLDASAVENDTSLNSLLHKGPNLQSDLFMLLLNFRLFKIAICADIKQMYLQLKVHPEFYKFQRIFYRFCKDDPLQLFEFKRVCFGLASSPFLALRTLKQLAEDEGKKYPLAAAVINAGQFYMDDVICTTHTVEDAIELADQLSEMFAAGCFDLLKWSSNSSQFLEHYPKELLHPSLAISFEPESSQKVLGVKWKPHKDLFTFDFAPKEMKCTKRNMLSVIAQLFDVLGFVAPVILFAKLLIKELWLLKIDWDEEPPAHIAQTWLKFQSELHILSQISIPRHIGITQNCEINLIAFSDASEKAYGAVLYIHASTPDGIVVSLLCAKSKVAPIKTVSLARLELCAAYLLSKLVRAVLTNYCSRVTIARTYAFSDSTVALNWINSSPHKLKTFVANRVSKIQNNLATENFFHVSGKENPSDCLSRGLIPAQLASHPLWFNGPTWMRESCKDWPVKQFAPDLNDLPETKTVVLNNVLPEKPLILAIAERSSNWSKLLRIFVYILRFSKRIITRGLITAEDLIAAELFIIRSLQEVYFAEYIEALNKGTALPRAIRKLRPILVDGIIRVGGRLSACKDISFDHKHPILLPSKDHIVNLIIEYVHRISCHAGPQLTLCLLRKKYWILSTRRIVRARILNTTFLKFLPAADVTNENSRLLSRFSLLDKLVQSYWKRWREEYLQTLQVRAKWNTESRPVKVGTIVLINQNCAPLHWPLGKVEKVFPGPDGHIRVALVKTKNGTLERPVVRLCPLPVELNN